MIRRDPRLQREARGDVELTGGLSHPVHSGQLAAPRLWSAPMTRTTPTDDSPSSVDARLPPTTPIG